MRKIVLLFLFLITLLFPQISFAHVLKTDSSVGAVIHIDPEDDPIVGQPSNIYFEFKDRENKFKASECDCQFIVLKNGMEVFNAPIFGDSAEPTLTSSAVTYTFPEKDIYQVQVKGSPKNGSNFQSFTLTYDIRVERTEETGSQQDTESQFTLHWFHYLIIGIGIVGVIGIIVWGQKKK